jgi:hypothetical protein
MKMLAQDKKSRSENGPYGFSYALWRTIWAPFWLLANAFPGPLGLRPPQPADHRREVRSAGRLRPLRPRVVDWLRLIVWPLALVDYALKRCIGGRRTAEQPDPATLKWWELYIFGTLRRVRATGHADVVHVALFLFGGFVSTAIALDKFTEDKYEYAAYFILLSYIAVPLILLVLCYSGYAALRRLPEDHYARAALAGRTETEVLRALAYEMHAGVSDFRRQIESLDRHLRGFVWLGTGGSGDSAELALSVRGNRDTLNDALNAYRNAESSARHHRRRLIMLKEHASTVLGISKRRLCDHVLNYSPVTHDELALHYGNLWGSILRNAAHPGGDTDVLLRNATRCRWMARRFEEKSALLEQLFRVVDIHKYIYRIASRHSTSGAILEYAEALHYVVDRLDAAISEAIPAHDDFLPLWQATAERLELLHEKQKAYPGVNVHQTCRNAFTHSSNEAVRAFFAAASAPGGLTALGSDPAWWEKTSQVRRGLRELRSEIDRRIAEGRHGIVENFRRTELPWLTVAGAGRAFIVTHGYSKTVRSVLTHPDLRDFRIVVSSSGEADFEDARKMVYEITEDPGAKDREVAAGDMDLLPGFVDDEDRVMAILGAECFDDDGRVLHPRGARDKIVQLKTALDSSNKKIGFKVVFVAEEYKRIPDKMVDGFFKNFHDRMDIYPPDFPKTILSDRRDERLSSSLTATLVEGNSSMNCKIVNMSERGVLLDAVNQLHSGKTVQLELQLSSGDCITCDARVLHVHGPLAGAKLGALTPEMAKVWNDLLGDARLRDERLTTH